MTAEIAGPSPFDGQHIVVPPGVIAVVFITAEGPDYRADYLEVRGARVDRDAVAEALSKLALQASQT